jgi:hypothetical protein
MNHPRQSLFARVVAPAAIVFAAFASATAESGSAAAAPDERLLSVRVDPRTELLSILFRHAGNPEYNTSIIGPYTEAIDRWFGEFADHPAIDFARRTGAERGIGFSDPMFLAINLEPGYGFRLREGFAFSCPPAGSPRQSPPRAPASSRSSRR